MSNLADKTTLVVGASRRLGRGATGLAASRAPIVAVAPAYLLTGAGLAELP